MTYIKPANQGALVVMIGMALESMGGISTVECLIMQHMPADVEVSHISMFDYGSNSKKIRIFAGALVRVLFQMVTRTVDLVHIHFAERGSVWRTVILMLISFAFRKPVVLHAHACEFPTFYHSLPKVAQSLLRAVFRRCDRFIALSDSWKEFYAERLDLSDDQVTVLFNPVKLPPEVPIRSSEPIRLVFLGRIGHRKGAFDSIQAFARLPEAVRQRATMTLAGDYQVEKARQMVRDLGLTESVTVLDWLSPAQRDEQLARSHIFLLPSRHEGLPMSLLEAMGWGLASITSPVGGIPELVTPGKDALLVEPGNVDELAIAMQSLIEDEGLRAALAERARARVTSLDIGNYCRQLLTVYQSVLRPEAMALTKSSTSGDLLVQEKLTN